MLLLILLFHFLLIQVRDQSLNRHLLGHTKSNCLHQIALYPRDKGGQSQNGRILAVN